MEIITITVDINGNSIERKYKVRFRADSTWGEQINDMIEVIQASEEKKF